MSSEGRRFCSWPDTMPLQETVCKWPVNRITWTVTGELNGVSEEAQKEAYSLAWSYWAEVCEIEPVYQTNARTAMVLMGARAIDAPGGVLAESELPCGHVGQLQQWYDTRERWVIDESPLPGQMDLVRVAAHEIGHVIGLPHIAQGNLLQPMYSTKIRRPQAGDIAEACRRYGARRRRPDPGPVVPAPTPGGRTMDAAELQRSLERIVSWLAWGAKWTPNQTDDKIADFLQQAVKNEWVVKFLAFLIEQFGKGNLSQLSDAALAQALADFKAANVATA